jgi:lactoylglutathione lyase
MLQRRLLYALLPALAAWGIARDAEPGEVFAHDTIQVGIVVSDLEASATWYTEVLGFAETEGFEVPAQLCTDAGLTDEQPLTVRVFTSDAMNDDATRVKLMEQPGVESKRSDNTFIHSQLGLSYLTIGVRDIDASMARVHAAGGKALAKGPVQLGSRPDSDWLALVRDPDGNLIELIGPKP